MENGENNLLSLLALAAALKLPVCWLKGEADKGNIPHLRIGKRYRFNRSAVEAALLERAAKPDADPIAT